jgi:3-oxoadipate enol-lactonase
VPTIGRLRYLEAVPPADARARGTLVLLHAFPLNARMWEGQLGLAETGWHLIAPQLRGFDGDGGDPPAASMDDYAGDVIDLLDALHLKQAVIGGLSMGGYVAFADTRSQADTPEGRAGREKLLQVVEEKGAAGVAGEMIPKLLGETTRATRPAVVEQVRSLVLANPAAAIGGAIHALMTRPDSTPLLAGIHVPTLIVVGAEDTVTPPSAAEEMHRAIGGSKLVRIPAAGHLSNLEQPVPFNAALAAFLSHRV